MSTVGNVYCAILAGGSGTRMKTPTPKQFLMLGDAPVFVHCARTLLANPQVKQLWIGSNGDWLKLAQEQVDEFFPGDGRIHICAGGADRESTMLNTIAAIKENNNIADNDVVLIHDAVRPFVTERIVSDVIAELEFCDACNTVVSVNDTIIHSSTGKYVTGMPARSELYNGQSPQGFKINRLLEAFANISDDQRKTLTDTTRVCFQQGIAVHIVRGEYYNFKITTQFDLQLARGLLSEGFIAR